MEGISLYYVKSRDDRNIPSWLSDNLEHDCVYCNHPMENYYNDNEECTGRRCSNPHCPEMLARRLTNCAVLTELSGVKIGTCRKVMMSLKEPKSHFEGFSSIFNEKPKVNLATLFRMCCIEGIDMEWNDVCSKFTSVDEFFDKAPAKYINIAKPYMEELKLGESQVELVSPRKFKYDPVITGNVMMSGPINGFSSNRAAYCTALKVATDGLIDIREVGKRQTGVMALIKEADSPIRSKYNVAKENGIPIFTSEEFSKHIINKLMEVLGGM